MSLSLTKTPLTCQATDRGAPWECTWPFSFNCKFATKKGLNVKVGGLCECQDPKLPNRALHCNEIVVIYFICQWFVVVGQANT